MFTFFYIQRLQLNALLYAHGSLLLFGSGRALELDCIRLANSALLDYLIETQVILGYFNG